jgi:uncharacterized membrane protein (UPF0127 family)
MKVIRILNPRSGILVARRARVADNWLRRAIGLLGRNRLPWGSGLLLVPCASIHTKGMRFALDVAFLDKRGTVVQTWTDCPPGKIVTGGSAAHSVLEVPVGALAVSDTREGDVLLLEETTE